MRRAIAILLFCVALCCGAFAQVEKPVFSKTDAFIPAWKGHVRRITETRYTFGTESASDSSKTIYSFSDDGNIISRIHYLCISGGRGKPNYWSVDATMRRKYTGSIKKGRVLEIQTNYNVIYDEKESIATTYLFNPQGCITSKISVSKNASGITFDSFYHTYMYNNDNNIVSSYWYGFRNNAVAGSMKVYIFRSDTEGWQHTTWKSSKAKDTLFQVTSCSDTSANDSFYQCRVIGSNGFDSIFYYHHSATLTIRHFDTSNKLTLEQQYDKGKKWLHCTYSYDDSGRLTSLVTERTTGTTTKLLEYDAAGNLATETVSWPRGEDKIEYGRYDVHGNCREELHYQKGKLHKKIVRLISYY